MRVFQAYLILRFLTWPPAILTIAGLAIAGFVINALGLDKPSHPTDYVCIGQMRYDLNDRVDREKIRDDMVQWGAATIKALQRPPCDGFGSPVYQASINKLFVPERELAR